MNRTIITLVVFLLLSQQYAIAQTGQWKLSGNTLAGTEKLGSKNNFPLKFITNNVQRMTLTGSGQLGIGTAFPEANLHVFRGTADDVSPHPDAILATENSGDNFINLLAPPGSKTGILFGAGLNNQDGAIVYNSVAAKNGMQFNTGGSITRMTLTNTGALGIGTGTPKAKLHVFGGSSGNTPLSNSTIVTESTNDNFISLLAPTTKESAIIFGTTENNQDGAIVYNNPAAQHSMQFNTSGLTRMTISSIGDVTITGSRLKAGSATGAKITVGSFESIIDGGNAILQSNSTIVPETDAVGSLGLNDARWDEVVTVNGVIQTSDARDKTNIRDLNYGLKDIMKLRSVKFNWLNKSSDGDKIGLIAQEIQKVIPEAVHDWEYVRDEKTGIQTKVPAKRLGVNYADFIPVLIKGMQEQQQIIEKLKADMEEMKKEKTSSAISQQSVNNEGKANGILSVVHLNQNAPNPFNSATVINYYLPETKGNALIEIVSSNGQLIKSYPVTQKGNGQLAIKAGEFAAGTYYYTLKVNGTKVDSKQMVLVK